MIPSRSGVIVAALLTAGLVLFETAPLPAAFSQLVGIPTDAAPLLDGLAREQVWNRAPGLTVKMQGVGTRGAASGVETTVQLQAVYTRDSVYFLVRWNDPTHSIDRQPWSLEGSGRLQQDRTPLERGGTGTSSEDTLAFLWVTRSSKVIEQGTFWPTYLHGDAAETGYARGKSAPTGQRFDLWHWTHVSSALTTRCQVDDRYMEDTLGASIPGAGQMINARKAERPFADSRSGLRAGHTWANGTYTLEIGRRLSTADPTTDVIFTDLSVFYFFGVATFDNTQIRHAASGAIPFIFLRR